MENFVFAIVCLNEICDYEIEFERLPRPDEYNLAKMHEFVNRGHRLVMRRP